jgi:hypothetical protein
LAVWPNSVNFCDCCSAEQTLFMILFSKKITLLPLLRCVQSLIYFIKLMNSFCVNYWFASFCFLLE